MRTGFFQNLATAVLPPVVLISVVAGALYLLGTVPTLLQPPTTKDYPSLEEVKKELGIEIALPTYFPDYLLWPPARITVHSKPRLLLSLLFLSREKGEEALWIDQVIANGDEPSKTMPLPQRIVQENSISLRGSQGLLIVSEGEGGRLYNQVRWVEGDRGIVITTTYPAEELLKIAHSMRRR